VTLYTGLASGSDLHVESSFGQLYYSTSNAINSLPISGADGGVAPTATTVVSGSFNATNLEANSSRFFWLESGGYAYASSSKSTNMTGIDTAVPPTSSNKWVVPDSQSSFYVWIASSSSIYHAYYSGGASTKPFRTGLSGITGMTADSQYVYWNQSDGLVRRASRSGF
jgi:hypothetical protein